MTQSTKRLEREIARLRNVRDGLRGDCTRLQSALSEALEDHTAALEERNRLVAAYSRFWPAHLQRHQPDPDPEWDPDWLWVVCVHGPTGHMAWHLKNRDLPLFGHLPREEHAWDGHTTEEKYDRLARVHGRELICGGCKAHILYPDGVIAYDIGFREFYCSMGCQVKRRNWGGG